MSNTTSQRLLPRVFRRGRAGAAWAGGFLRDQRGATAVIATIMFPILIAGMGLGAETGYWYMKQRNLQHAADVAVHAAGLRKKSGDATDEIEAAALYIATQTGFVDADGAFAVNSPTETGPYAGNPSTVEVLLSEEPTRLFSALFTDAPLTLTARAVVLLSETTKACILTLAPTAPGALTLSGSTSLELEGCDVASNSNAPDSISMEGSASLSTGCAYTVGSAVTTASLTLTVCEKVKEFASPVADPYAAVPEPVVQGTCQDKNLGKPNNSTTITPTETHPSGVKAVRFCNGLSVKGDVVFEPGLYIIEGGDFTVNGSDAGAAAASLRGEGVTFFLTNGAQLKLNGNASLDLAAPVGGPFSGLLFFGGRDQSGVAHKLTGSSESTLQGAIYTPASDIVYRGNSDSDDGCTQIVAFTASFSGNSSLESECDDDGTTDIQSNQTVQIVE